LTATARPAGSLPSRLGFSHRVCSQPDGIAQLVGYTGSSTVLVVEVFG
jgi:hypothetical protein